MRIWKNWRRAGEHIIGEQSRIFLSKNWMLDAGCWILDTGSNSVIDAGLSSIQVSRSVSFTTISDYRIPNSEYRIPIDTEYRIPITEYMETQLTRKDIDLMAPVGSFESLMAAIQGNADSVYFGLGKLNMRARSSVNFTAE